MSDHDNGGLAADKTPMDELFARLFDLQISRRRESGDKRWNAIPVSVCGVEIVVLVICT